ncbi:MAG: helix-turn-helix transcriptional regulator [bacterium]|nr:helix-turn-helix transcriptional regulator [bacterium]
MGLKASIPVPEKALKNTPSALEPATKEDNIVKKVCRELGITQVELGKMLGVGQSAVATWASGQIPKVAEVAICLMLENKEKDSILQSIKKVKNYLENLT